MPKTAKIVCSGEACAAATVNTEEPPMHATMKMEKICLQI